MVAFSTESSVTYRAVVVLNPGRSGANADGRARRFSRYLKAAYGPAYVAYGDWVSLDERSRSIAVAVRVKGSVVNMLPTLPSVSHIASCTQVKE